MPEQNAKQDSTILAALINKRAVIIAAILALAGTIAAALIYKFPFSFSNASATFTGRVLNAKTEERVRGAKVSLEVEGVPPVIYTDSEGVFSFPATDPNKEVRLRIEARDFENFDLRVIPAKYTGIQDIRLTVAGDSKPELSGTVLDNNEKPLQGARVILDDIPGLAPVETSSDGVFVLKDLPRKYGESVRVRVSREGYQPNPYTEDVVLGKTPPRIKLRRKR